MIKGIKILLCIHLLFTGVLNAAFAQEERLSITVQQDGDVYIHHVESLPFGFGFNIYRQEAGGEFIKLNEEVVKRVSNGPELVQKIGNELYKRLQHDLETASSTETLLRLKSDHRLSLLLSFSYPAIAEALGFLYIDTDAPSQGQLKYRIELINSLGETTGEQFAASANPDPLSIEAPEGLKLSMNGNLLEASWKYPNPAEPEKVSGFYLYRESPDGKLREQLNEAILLLTEDQTFSQSLELPLDGATYGYFVKAVDITGQESAPSAKVNYTLSDITPPAKVKQLRTHVLPNGRVELSWPTSVDADAEGYHVYRAPRSVDSFKRVNKELVPLLQTVFVDSTVTPGNKYMYTITAVDSLGNESEKSMPASALLEDHTPPEAPVDLQARYLEASKTVSLSWKESNAADFRSYMLLRRRKENEQYGSFSQLNDSTLRKTIFEDEGLARIGFPAGAIFQYGVVAIDKATNFSDTTFVIFQIPDLEAPEAPTAFSASGKDGYRAVLNWNASTSKDVVSYKLFKDDSLLALLPYSDRYYRDKEVEVGSQYIYQLKAVDSLGNESKAMSDTLLMRDKNPPAAARNLQAATTAEGVKLSWEAVPNEDLTGYKIFRCEIPTGVYVPVAEREAAQQSWTDPDGRAGLWYKIIAEDSSGNESKWSSPAQAVRVQ